MTSGDRLRRVSVVRKRLLTYGRWAFIVVAMVFVLVPSVVDESLLIICG